MIEPLAGEHGIGFKRTERALAFLEDMPPEMKAMMEQSYQFMADAWKEMVFWFPEFPEEKLDIGDEFDMTRKMAGGGGGNVAGR